MVVIERSHLMLEKIINELIVEQDIEALNEMHPFDLVSLYEALGEQKQKDYFVTLLIPENYAALLSYLNPEEAANYLEELPVSEQETLLGYLDPDDAADILAELPEDVSRELVSTLGSENKAVALLQYGEEEAGALMNNLFVTVSVSDDVKTATKKVISAAGDVSSIQTIFVTDEAGHYEGQMPLKTLLKAKPPLLVSDIVIHETTFNDKAQLSDVIQFMREYSDHDLAIINDEQMLVGVSTLR